MIQRILLISLAPFLHFIWLLLARLLSLEYLPVLRFRYLRQLCLQRSDSLECLLLCLVVLLAHILKLDSAVLVELLECTLVAPLVLCMQSDNVILVLAANCCQCFILHPNVMVALLLQLLAQHLHLLLALQ